MNKKILIVGVLMLVVGFIIGFGFNIFVHTINQTKVPLNTDTPPVLINVPLVTKLDQVEWTAPILVPNLDIMKNANDSENKVETYKIGTFVTGNYKGGEIFSVTVISEIYIGDEQSHFVKLNGKITLLSKNSDRSYDGDPLDYNKFLVDDTTILSDLIFPDKLTYKGNTFSFEGDNLHEPLFSQKYNSSNTKLAFVDPKFGNVYTDNHERRNIADQNGYYLIAPDGTLRTYSSDINFYDTNHRIPQVTWNDNTVNTTEYADTDRGGCGSKNYASVTYGLSAVDLTAAGRTVTGDTVYELSNPNNLIIKNIYNDDYNPYDSPKLPYDQFIQSHPVFFWYDSFGRLIKFQKTEFIPQAECGKPVIYLYPKETTKVSVKISPKGGLTVTEPDYGNGWNVLADKNSQLTDLVTGKIYPYLFWEGRGGIYTTPEKGFVVAELDVHNFLIEKLTRLGLNQKERADFIDFWEPRMTGAPYFFVTFLGNKEMDEIAPLTVTPKPDSVIRVLMDFKPLQKPISVQGYEIRTPKRDGFTVVEWGGVLR